MNYALCDKTMTPGAKLGGYIKKKKIVSRQKCHVKAAILVFKMAAYFHIVHDKLNICLPEVRVGFFSVRRSLSTVKQF